MTKDLKIKSKKRDSRKTDKDASGDLIDQLKNFVRTRGSEYLKDHNISSVGIGHKKKDGKPTKELAIQFTVKRKAQPEELETLGTVEIPQSFVIEGVEVPTDVIQRQYDVEYRLVAEAQTSNRKNALIP